MISFGIGQRYPAFPLFALSWAQAVSMTLGFSERSMAVAAIICPAYSIPLWAKSLFPQATACQLWAAVPMGHVLVPHCVTGQTQLTSPTSEEPGRGMFPALFHGFGLMSKANSGLLSSAVCVLTISSAKARSSAFYTGLGISHMFLYITSSRAGISRVLLVPFRNLISTVVSVIRAAPRAMLFTLS